ncbi:uncharacterized protein LOC111052512 isoform X2 [Nilaparvata lugens]|uniref:uncharacterized protein LOC111052512 isoform X2 n=1 Tax=Nilaparvata lugens TaxID=108931 RepID=UPI00193D99AD|nr:uncharacterized protein LOC111052512 isoform X2 [Nilaparvata lugens]
MFEVKTDKRDNCEEEIFTVDYIASRIKTEIDCDETSIQGLNNNVFSLDIDAIKHEVETDNFHEHKSESEKGDDYNVSHYIKDEVDIDGESSQLSMKDFPHDIADGSAKHAQVEHDNFHGQKFAGEEEEEEDEVVEDDDNEQEEEIDDYDISNYIKDEIDIDENPFQLPMTEFPLDGSVKQVEDNHCINADAGIVAGVVKNEIDVYEEFPINIVKEEFSNEPSVDPFLPKIEPMEVYLNDNSQLYDDLEFKLFGRVAVVSAFRLEDLGTNVGSSLEAHRPNEGCEPSVEAGSPFARSLKVEKDMEGMESSMQNSSDGGCRNCTIMNDKLENMQKSLNSMLVSVDRKWEILRLETREMREAIEAILKLNSNKIGFSSPSIEKEDREEFEKMLPIHNLDEFLGLEEKLKEESQRNLLVDFLQRIGGGNVEDAVRRALVRLVTNEVATNFSWEGRKGKRALNSLLIIKTLEKVVAASHTDFTSKLFEIRVKEWFRQSGTRIYNLKKSTKNNTFH